MAKEEAPDKDAEAAPAGPRMVMGMPLPLFAFVAVNVLVMVCAFAFILHASLIYQKPAITEEQVGHEITKVEKKKAAEVGDGYFPVSYSEMTITLKSEQGGKSHFATGEATLICGTEICQEQVKGNKAKVEDAIQTVLSARSYTELGSLETKFRVKHEILGTVNMFLKNTAATDLLFTAFLVQ